MKVYIYVTKAKPYLFDVADEPCFKSVSHPRFMFASSFSGSVKDLNNCLNGKIVASFELNEAENLSQKYASQRKDGHFYDVLEKACLTAEELEKYCPTGSKKKACAWKIESLQILDEPFNLGDFAKDRAPQSWGYATINGAKCVLVSIRPEWACKILNGEKTIEVRKSAPKGVEA